MTVAAAILSGRRFISRRILVVSQAHQGHHHAGEQSHDLGRLDGCPWARSLMVAVDSSILPVSGHAGFAGPIPKPAALRLSDILICQTDRPDWSRCGVRQQPQSPARVAMPSSCHRGL